ncbi:MAG: chromosomal replication initiator protein DnaA [SAR324 cluster bacterium]|nr:chromosomal replication initiator protein DnaA [SAR324 cluster bacterium]
MDFNQQWTVFKKNIRELLRPEEYEGWLEAIQIVELEHGRAVIAGIPHPVFQYDIKKNYDVLFRKVLGDLFPEKAPFYKKNVEYHVGEYQFKTRKTSEKQTLNQLSLFDESSTAVPEVSEKAGKEVSRPVNKVVRLRQKPVFDPKYIFSSFVVGSSNRLAYKAASMIAQTPGVCYNPFVITGTLSTGKTFLLQSIGQAIEENYPGLQIAYITAESFLNDFLYHLKHGMSAFRQKYREADVFLLDDLHILAGARECQKELLNTITTLLQMDKQIVMTSQQQLHDIKTLDPTLRSRLEGGLTVEVMMPDVETRMAILDSKAAQRQMNLPPQVTRFMAEYIYSDVRKLEGALTRLGAYASLAAEEISLDFAFATLENFLDRTPTGYDLSNIPQVSTEKILERICNMFQVTQTEVLSKKRERRIVLARSILMYMLKELTTLSLKDIGAKIGGRSHSAVHNAIRHLKAQMLKDEFFQRQIHNLIREFSQTQLPEKIIPSKKQSRL